MTSAAWIEILNDRYPAGQGYRSSGRGQSSTDDQMVYMAKPPSPWKGGFIFLLSHLETTDDIAQFPGALQQVLGTLLHIVAAV